MRVMWLVMEKLAGGGGHMSIEAQLTDCTIDQGR